MSNKALRILIADENGDRLIQVEKLLNRLNYYRIAPVSSFDELRTLTQYAIEPFDLLIANKDLSVKKGVDLAEFCQGAPQIHHVLIYESQDLQRSLVPVHPHRPMYFSLPHIPDSGSIEDLMGLIDPPSQWVSLESLSWLQEAARRKQVFE
ncbi:histidine kinase [Pseudomonas lini]